MSYQTASSLRGWKSYAGAVRSGSSIDQRRMKISSHRGTNAPATAAAMQNATLVVTGADFLLSMVEARMTSHNGDRRKMDSGLRAQQELEKIEQQIERLEAVNQDENTRQQIHQLHERVHALREQVSVQLSAWQKTELARHPQRPYTLDYIERIFTDWSEIHGDRGFADDPAIICGMARFGDQEVL